MKSAPGSRCPGAFLSPLALLLLWLLLAGVLSWPRLADAQFDVTGDVPIHVFLTRCAARSFAEGEWLPRWAGLLNGGRGCAFFTLYPPLFYWLAGGAAAGLGIGIPAALRCVAFLAVALAGVSAWFLAREFFGRAGSALVAVGYVVLPAFPFLAFPRGFLPNALALAVMPLALLGGHLLLTGERPRRGLALFALGFGAVILTHSITAYLTGLSTGLLALCHLRRAGARGLLRLGGGVLLALAWTAFFWVPLAVELGWTQIGGEARIHDYHSSFLFASDQVTSSYFSAWGGVNEAASLVTVCQTVLAGVLGFVCWRAPRPAARTPIVAFALAVAGTGLFIALPLSGPLWRWLPGMPFLQFSWRYQPFVALAVALLAAASGPGWSGLGRAARRVLVAGLAGVVLATGALSFLIWCPPAGADRREGGSPPAAPGDTRAPFWANQVSSRPRGADAGFHPAADRVGGAALVAGDGRVEARVERVSHRAYGLEHDGPVRVRLETYAYPNWVARVDGRRIGVQAEPGTGLMLVEVPARCRVLTLDYEVVNPVEKWAPWVSVAAALLGAGWLGWRRRVGAAAGAPGTPSPRLG